MSDPVHLGQRPNPRGWIGAAGAAEVPSPLSTTARARQPWQDGAFAPANISPTDLHDVWRRVERVAGGRSASKFLLGGAVIDFTKFANETCPASNGIGTKSDMAGANGPRRTGTAVGA